MSTHRATRQRYGLLRVLGLVHERHSVRLKAKASLSIYCRRVRAVEGSCAKRLTREFYTVVMLLILKYL